MMPTLTLRGESQLERHQQLDIAQRRWDAELELARELDQAEIEHRALRRDAKVAYEQRCATARHRHRSQVTQAEALSLEARIEAAELARDGR